MSYHVILVSPISLCLPSTGNVRFAVPTGSESTLKQRNSGVSTGDEADIGLYADFILVM